MDAQAETARFKAMLGAFALFVGSGFFAYGELMYLARGRDATAAITDARRVTKRSSFGRDQGSETVVEYRFTDADGHERTGTHRGDGDFPVPADRKLAVRYRPGADAPSRPAGQIGWLTLTVFAVGLTAVSVFGYRLWKEANDTGPRPRRKPYPKGPQDG